MSADRRRVVTCVLMFITLFGPIRGLDKGVNLNQTPRRTGADKPAQSVEHLAQ